MSDLSRPRRRWLRYVLRTLAIVALAVGTSRAADKTTEAHDAARIKQFLDALPTLDFSGQQQAKKELDQAITDNLRRPAWIQPLLKAILENRASQSAYFYSVLHRMARADQAQFKDHVPVIANLISPRESMETWYAINLLLELGPTASPATNKLTELVRDESLRRKYHRIRSIGALARIHPQESQYRETLLQELSSQERNQRMAAAAALGLLQVKDRDLIARLLKITQDDESPGVRVIAAGSAYQLSGDAAAVIPLLVTALSEEDASVTVSPTSFSSWTPSHRHYAISALGSMKGDAQSAVPELLKLMADNDDTIRSWSIKAVGRIGNLSDEARKALEASTLLDPNRGVRDEAKAVLEQLPREKN